MSMVLRGLSRPPQSLHNQAWPAVVDVELGTVPAGRLAQRSHGRTLRRWTCASCCPPSPGPCRPA